jgi:alpha-glucosidase (family GH31 glycosyl hydrolase)
LSNQLIDGNNFVTNDVSNYKFPVFYKEGSFIPNYFCSGENTSTIKKELLKVIYIPSNTASSYELFEDDGENHNSIKERQFQLTKLISSGNNNSRLNIKIDANGRYKNVPNKRNIQLVIPALVAKPKKITVNGKRIDFATTKGISNATAFAIWSSDIGAEENNILTIPLTLQATTLNIEIRF